jgi:predicted signal transduction protein with EAL and GGDEF domain
VDAIKLDRSFVQSIDTDRLAHRLVQAMIGVAQGLGLNVVAEGVETEGQRDALLEAGCSLMQGFLFARPQPAIDMETFLQSCQTVGDAPVQCDPDWHADNDSADGPANIPKIGENLNDLLQLTVAMGLGSDLAVQSFPS